jgi:formylglycine-generating enzyme required for sulfatase activity/predicted ATPase
VVQSVIVRPAIAQKKEPPDTPVLPEEVDRKSNVKNQILILVSSPLVDEDLQPVEETLSIQQEIENIVDVLRDLPSKIEIEIIVKIATTESIIESFINSFKSLIVHFIGHGMKDDEGISLVLEDREGIARSFSVEELRNLLRNLRNPPCQIAFLNACHSQGMAGELLNAGVSHVVAINAEDPILDTASRCFARVFYAALFNSDRVQESYEWGQNAVMVNDELKRLAQIWRPGINIKEAIKFRLLPENDAVHQNILRLQSHAQGKIIAPHWDKTNIDSDDSTFIGRKIEIHEIAVALNDDDRPRCIALHGMGGMGKTALAIASARWQHERRRWHDGVWFIDLRNVDSADAARIKIIDALSLEINATERGRRSNNGMKEALRDLNLLLVLDDVDILLAQETQDFIDLIDALLSCRRLRLLITSRLELPGELFYQSKEVQTIEPRIAQQIFRKYAPSEEQWNLDENSEEDWENLMQFLDGYPLAIRIAAVYMKQRKCSLHKLWQGLEEEYRKILSSPLYQKNKRNSLDTALNLSYEILPPGAKEMFPQLALFPGGITEEAAEFIFGKDGIESLEFLLLYSMTEKKTITSPWRLPEPARRYAEKKQLPNAMEEFAPRALEYYYRFVNQLDDLLIENKISEQNLQQQIFAEQSNLKHFLYWGYEAEKRKDRICCSARITASLAKNWQWVIPGANPLYDLESAFQAAKRNHDKLGEARLSETKGDILRSRQQENIARESYNQVISRESYNQAIEFYSEISENLSSLLEKAKIQKKIGNIWEKYPDTEKALESYLTAINLYDSDGEVLEVAHIRIMIGDLLRSQQRLEEASDSYQEALELYQLEGDRTGMIKAENRLRSAQVGKLIPFEFEVITVNSRGEIVNREEKTARYFSEDLGDGIVLDMVEIPGGSFKMGAAENEQGAFEREYPQHEVTVSSFFMGKYPITQAQWKAIASRTDLKVERDLNTNPAYFQDFEDSDRRPVERVSWNDAVEFCQRLSKLTGGEYRLPSEAEWEYACRGMKDTPFHFGKTITGDLANYNANYTYANEPQGQYRAATTPVGQFPPNSFGLYDLHGNVWEWCEDDWHSGYKEVLTDGSAWIESDNNITKITRGGSWCNNPWHCRSACRSSSNRADRSSNYGFRIVRL